jgi:hypothetical protein
MRALGLVFSAFCMATVLALLIGVGYLVATGRLDRHKLAQMVAVVHGLDLLSEPAATVEARPTAGVQRSDLLAVRSQDLDLRERFIDGQRNDLDTDRRKLMAEKAQLAEERAAFKRQRTQWEEGEKAKGIDDVVQIISKVSIDVAKDMLMKEPDMDAAVALMRKLPVDRQAKILDACTSAEEVRKRAEIIRRIRDGQPPLPAAEKSP